MTLCDKGGGRDPKFVTSHFKNSIKAFEYLLFGLKNRGLLILLLPDVSPASVAGIFRGHGSWVVARRRSISRPRFLSPKSKHSNISADRESLNQVLR